MWGPDEALDWRARYNAMEKIANGGLDALLPLNLFGRIESAIVNCVRVHCNTGRRWGLCRAIWYAGMEGNCFPWECCLATVVWEC